MRAELDELQCSIAVLVALRPDKVWRHTLGTDISQDTLLFEEKDPMFHVGMGKSR